MRLYEEASEITDHGSVTSEILSYFFAISPLQIREDLDALSGRSEGFYSKEYRQDRTVGENSQSVVESLHRRLVLGANLTRSSQLPADLILFASTVTAHEVAEISCSDSCGRGRLLELSKITEDSDESVSGQADSIFERIHDAVFLEVLERYGIHEFTGIFEGNRSLYEIRCEVGRRLILGPNIDAQEHKETVARFHEIYGPKLVAEFLRRLKSHNLLAS